MSLPPPASMESVPYTKAVRAINCISVRRHRASFRYPLLCIGVAWSSGLTDERKDREEGCSLLSLLLKATPI